jgi:hypothetical protein
MLMMPLMRGFGTAGRQAGRVEKPVEHLLDRPAAGKSLSIDST